MPSSDGPGARGAPPWYSICDSDARPPVQMHMVGLLSIHQHSFSDAGAQLLRQGPGTYPIRMCHKDACHKDAVTLAEWRVSDSTGALLWVWDVHCICTGIHQGEACAHRRRMSKLSSAVRRRRRVHQQDLQLRG